MPYLVVDNFSGGLDGRRHVLSSKDGTLAILKNAHITRGGEIEKRKAFAQFASLPANTFGLETTADAIYVFGSAAAPSMPAGVTYQRLQHPANLSMTKVVWSTVYGGKPFVIAEFSNGNRLCFWDGAVVGDWFIGVVGISTSDLASQLVSSFNYDKPEGYTITYLASNKVRVTAPNGRGFTLTGSISAASTGVSPTISVAKTQNISPVVDAAAASGSFSITDGRETRAVHESFGRHMDAASLPGIRSIRVGASSPTATDGVDLLNWTATTGIKYNTATITDAYGSNFGALMWQLRKVINENTATTGYSARWASYGGWSGNDPANLWIDAPASQGATANGDLVQVEFDTNPSGIYLVSEFIDVSTIANSPYNNGKHIATMRNPTFSGGEFGAVEEIKVDGVNIMGSRVQWSVSNSATMAAVAASINTRTNIHGYTASTADGKVFINGTEAMGATPNGKRIVPVTSGTVVISLVQSMSGGKTYYAGDPEIWEVTLGGSGLSTNGTKVSVTLTDPLIADPFVFGASRVTGLKANFSITYKAKEYAAVGSTMYFSSLNDAKKWDIHDLGSGFIDMSNNFGGREELTGFGVYQDKLAVFSRRNVQLWFLDADPAQNQQLQILANTGCIAPDSVVSMGAIDLLYLADNGIRSLRAREGTDTAFASDIGSPVDNIVTTYLATITDDQKSKAKAVVEPIDGRYWLAVGDRVFVLSYFPGSDIAAWSTYETGFTVEEFAVKGNQVFARSGNTIYLYGGADGNTFDTSEVIVEFPYMDARKPAHYKRAKAIDLTIEGLWRAEMGFDHTNPDAREVVLRASDATFAYGSIPVAGIGTHFGLRLVNNSAAYAKVSNVILHYDDLHPKHEAG